MKKVLLKMVNAFIIIGFLWTALAGIYVVAVPQDIKDMLPDFTWATALVSGGATGLFSSLAVYIKFIIKGNQAETNGKLQDFAEYSIKIVEHYKEIGVLYKAIKDEIDKLVLENNIDNINNEVLNNELVELKNLIKVDLQSKLTNPLIDKEAEKKIREVLYEEEEKETDI